MMKFISAVTMFATLALSSHAAFATDEAAEYWFSPAIALALDDDTGLKLETAQRFRSEADGRPDTYFAQVWLTQAITANAVFGGALERRINDGASHETRVMQQLSTRHGIIRTRTRLEQRFVESSDNMGLRVRPRLGVVVPLTDHKRLQFRTDAELFLTLRSTSANGDTGLTAFRTQIGFSYDVSSRIALSAVYVRQQDIIDGGTDIVGHAPAIGVELSL